MSIQTSGDLLGRVLRDRRVRPVFQPLVDLERNVVVGYEALARVQPAGAGCADPGGSPAALFEAGRAAGRLAELDWLCREQAVAAARDAGLRYPLSLFVNAEPETLLADGQDAARWGRFGDLRCYAELTERALAARPAALLCAVDQVRAQDWGIALDDVGADPASLALLPLVRPDVIKLDLGLLQTAPAGAGDLGVARVLHAALRQAADSGAVVVAEGIETEQHLALARAYGAHYGQGYLLGRPGPLPADLVSPPHAVPLLPPQAERAATTGPFAVLAGATGTRRTQAGAVRELARQLLAQACQLQPPPVVLVCANTSTAGEVLTGPLRGLLQELSRGPLLGLLGDAAPLAGLPGRHALLPADDPAALDFAVVVVGAYYSAALAARPTLPAAKGGQPAGRPAPGHPQAAERSGEPAPDPGAAGELDVAVTFDAGLSAAAGHVLLSRLA